MLILFAAVLCPFSCDLAEDDSDCFENMEITFRFTKNGQDRFGVEVSSIDLFVFDERGLYVGRWVEHDNTKFATGTYKMVIPLRAGTYSCVAWGGMKNGHYLLYDTDHRTPETVAGETGMDYMLLRARDGSRAREIDYRPTDLFYGNAPGIVLDKRLPGSKTEVVIDLVKNSKQVDFRITGLPLPTRANRFTNIDVALASANGGYTFMNDYETPPTTTIYNAVNADTDADGVYYSTVHTFRMNFGREIALKVLNMENNEEIISADLLEDFISKAPQYRTQAAIDAEDYFLVEIMLDSALGFSVIVNGWEVNTSGTGI